MSAINSAASSAPSTPRSHFSSLSGQVGGHPGVLASDDEAVIVKPALPAEAAFYTQIAEGHPALAKLRPFVPSYYGMLQLAGSAPPEGIDAGLLAPPTNIPDAEKSCIVLENIASAFSRPNILDIKLGTVLYDDNASPEKRERMLKAARATTSLETGVRITGFQVYNNKTHTPTIVPKTYGKSIRTDQLPEAMRHFFPLNTSEAANSFSLSQPQTSGEPNASSTDSSASASNEEREGLGLPLSLLPVILRGILGRTRALREAMAESELRLIGSSLLIVYEANWERAAQLLASPVVPGREKAETEALAVDAEGTIVVEGDGYAEDDENGGSREDDDEEDEDEDEDRLPYAVSLIDFAHTKLVTGLGADERVLFGIDTVIRLLEGRLTEVESESRNIAI